MTGHISMEKGLQGPDVYFRGIIWDRILHKISFTVCENMWKHKSNQRVQTSSNI